MPRMPTITSAVMIEFLKSLGFRQTRQRGSHKFFRHSDGRRLLFRFIRVKTLDAASLIRYSKTLS